MKSWSNEETEILIKNYNRVSNDVLQTLIPNKSAQGIYKKAYKMGLRKSTEIEFLNRSISKRRENASNWNGGFRISKHGYRQILAPGHHRADSGGYVMEHVYIFEQKAGITIPENCCIHHLNGDKSDNRIENLCMMLHGAHTAYHHIGTRQSEQSKMKMSEKRREYYAKQDCNSRKIC